MKRAMSILAAAAMTVVAAGTSAMADPVPIDHEIAVDAKSTAEWDGNAALGLNQNYFDNFQYVPGSATVPSNVPDQAPDEVEGPVEEALRGHTVENPARTALYEQFPVGTCDQGDAKTYCEHVHIALTNPVPEDDSDGRLRRPATITLSSYGPVPGPGSDFDLVVYESDAEGNLGPEIAHDGGLPLDEGDDDIEAREVVDFTVTTTDEEPTVYVIARVVYFTSPNSTYHGLVDF